MLALIDAAEAAGYWKLVSRVFVENAATPGLSLYPCQSVVGGVT